MPLPFNNTSILIVAKPLVNKINNSPIEPLLNFKEPFHIAANTLTIYMIYLLFHL